MKKTLINQLLTLVIFSFSLTTYGQTNLRLYSTFDDYINDKPLEGYEVVDRSYTNVFSSETVKIKKNGVAEKTNAADLPSEFFTYNDFLIRVNKKRLYIVLAAGKLCYYALYKDQPAQYYSENINGEIVKFRDKFLEEYLEKYNLIDAYKEDKPKRKFTDSESDVLNNRVKWKIKYFNLVNEKIK